MSEPTGQDTPIDAGAQAGFGSVPEGSGAVAGEDGGATAQAAGAAMSDTGPGARIVAVVVTHKRRELLAESLKVVASQSRPVDHLIVIDNGNEPEVADLVRDQPVESTYLGSAHNLGGAGGSRSACCTR